MIFLEAIFWIIVVCLCYLELAGLLFFRGGVGCLNCLAFYFLEAPFVSVFRDEFCSSPTCARLLAQTWVPPVFGGRGIPGEPQHSHDTGEPPGDLTMANKKMIKRKKNTHKELNLFFSIYIFSTIALQHIQWAISKLVQWYLDTFFSNIFLSKKCCQTKTNLRHRWERKNSIDLLRV